MSETLNLKRKKEIKKKWIENATNAVGIQTNEMSTKQCDKSSPKKPTNRELD